jgi:hypothetical protein
MAQIVSYELGVPMAMINIATTCTNQTPPPTATGGSFGTDIAAGAAIAACAVLTARLAPLKTANPTVCVRVCVVCVCVCVCVCVYFEHHAALSQMLVTECIVTVLQRFLVEL